MLNLKINSFFIISFINFNSKNSKIILKLMNYYMIDWISIIWQYLDYEFFLFKNNIYPKYLINLFVLLITFLTQFNLNWLDYD